MGGKKTWWIIGGVAVVIAAAIAYAAANRGGMPSYNQPNTTPSANSATGQNGPAGSYVAYNGTNFANAEGQRWLFFHAGWCPQCRALEQDIEDKGAPSGVTILKVDYDSAADLKKRYGVTLQTTFVAVDSEGNLVEKFVAYDDPSLDAVINALGN